MSRSYFKRHALVLTLILVASLYAAAENITLTTYLPSPHGVYQDVHVTNRLNVGVETATTPAQQFQTAARPAPGSELLKRSE